MDYEKKYKEALERAKEIKSKILYSHLSTESCKAVSEYIDTIIPELTESEDERIRKEIISFIQDDIDEINLQVSGDYDNRDDDDIAHQDWCEKAIAYLEKQKEIASCGIDEFTLTLKNCLSADSELTKEQAEVFAEAYGEELLNVAVGKIKSSLTEDDIIAFKAEKQKKQKSVVEVLAKAGLKPYRDGNQWCILAGDNIQEGICGFGDTVDDALYNFLMEVLNMQKEQKPELQKPHKGNDTNPYDMQVSEAQEYAINRGFGIPYNDGEVYVDERHITQTIGNILRWADEHPKEQKPNIELIQQSWYMEGYLDRQFDKEPKWILTTGEDGPKHELNPRYGEPLVKEQKFTENLREKRKKECPFRVKLDNNLYGCERYADMVCACDENCSWIVDYPKLKEIQDRKEQKEIVQWPNLSNCKHDCKTCFAKCIYRKEQNEEQKPAEKLSKEEYVKKFKALCDAYEIKLPNREYDIYHLCDDLSKLFIDSGKQKPEEKQDYSGLTDFERAIHRGFLCAGVENVPVEIIKETAQDCITHIDHKPAEWSEDFGEEVEKIHKRYPEVSFAKLTRIAYHFSKWANRCKDIEWSEDFEENIRNLLHDKLTGHSKDGAMTWTTLIDDKTLKDIVNGIWFYIGKEALKYPNKELNVTEWSEEDESNLQSCIAKIEIDMQHWDKDGNTMVDGDIKLIDWLKSLPKRINLQPKQEWSEEDEENMQAIIDTIKRHWLTLPGNTLISWLKSLRPQSHWKPSEEQLEVLLNAEGLVRANNYPENAKILASLYEQLKKL